MLEGISRVQHPSRLRTAPGPWKRPESLVHEVCFPALGIAASFIVFAPGHGEWGVPLAASDAHLTPEPPTSSQVMTLLLARAELQQVVIA